VGAHVGFCQNIYDSLFNAINCGMNSCQFFLGNPKSYTRQRVSIEDINACKKLLKHFPMNVFSHFPYVANLNGSVTALAWNGDSKQDAKTKCIIKELEYELSILSNFDGLRSGLRSGVVIHPGCYADRTIGLDTIAKSINIIKFSTNSKLILENCAGEGRKLCRDFSEIRHIIDGVNEDKRQNIGVCIDTAHIWGQGDYDLQKCEEIDRLFSDFDRIIGIEYFTLLSGTLPESGSVIDSADCIDRFEVIINSESLIWFISSDLSTKVGFVTLPLSFVLFKNKIRNTTTKKMIISTIKF